MKRDTELIRAVLIRVEQDPMLDGAHGTYTFEEADFLGHSPEEIAYHVKLVIEAGFLKTPDEPNLKTPALAIERLTWEGHEFLADTSDPGIWEKVKERTKGLPDVAISLMWELAKLELKQKLGLSGPA